MRRLLVLALIALAPGAAVSQDKGFQLPTASEVFHLRSLCAELGEKILQESVVGVALTEEQVSHYEPRSNRCYVELTVHAANLTEHSLHPFNRYLFDGQTKEMLAAVGIEHGRKSGMIFDKQHRVSNLQNGGWDDASEYIDAMMADDRK
jgi:hypothetical protein